MLKKTVLIITTLVCFFPTALPAGERVTAKGMSFFEAGREVVAREKAMDEAKRAAIEQAVGTMVESRTVVEDFQVVKDQIFSRTTGYLKNLNVLEEKKSDLGTYEVTIHAEVEIADLVSDLDRFNKIIGWQKNPRIAIVIEPKPANEYLAAAQKTVGLLTTKLKDDGFKVFKYSGPSDIQMGLLVSLNLELSSKGTKFQDLDLTLNEVSLSANIYRPGDGEIVAAASAVKSLPGENRLQALDKGARFCVDNIWRDLRRKLTATWEKELYSEREVYLIVKNISSHAGAEETAFIFKSDVSGVLDSGLITYRDQTAEFGIKYRGWPEQLLNELQMSYFKNKYFDADLEAISGNKILIRIK
ncbi:MAG: hypothetical protein P1P89_02865 [Desulfobacterales bacterium]|nr:hypothetical protein [Desulfobacterales bacterium]